MLINWVLLFVLILFDVTFNPQAFKMILGKVIEVLTDFRVELLRNEEHHNHLHGLQLCRAFPPLPDIFLVSLFPLSHRKTLRCLFSCHSFSVSSGLYQVSEMPQIVLTPRSSMTCCNVSRFLTML